MVTECGRRAINSVAASLRNQRPLSGANRGGSKTRCFAGFSTGWKLRGMAASSGRPLLEKPGRGEDGENKTPHGIAAQQPHPGRIPGAGITACWGSLRSTWPRFNDVKQPTALAKPRKAMFSEGGRRRQKGKRGKTIWTRDLKPDCHTASRMVRCSYPMCIRQSRSWLPQLHAGANGEDVTKSPLVAFVSGEGHSGFFLEHMPRPQQLPVYPWSNDAGS
ncbi:hypothetical protein B0J18DRAFT_260493 [Chaetomium sp. MPI-SDFR-AT-0129]|nr:hypothetical protein B0J18DRAFT_260493 [Chaetomium sp. MPI-SDFR-AT-0129]